MDALISPSRLSGIVEAIPSKSVAHRALICAALSGKNCFVRCPSTSVDIEATVSCLNALGAKIEREEEGYSVEPIREVCHGAVLDCRESGSTLRFMLPVAAALGAEVSFTGSDTLATRPLSPLYEELQAHGCTLSDQGVFPLSISGKLEGGRFTMAGDVSSQFITGLLLAASALHDRVEVAVLEPVESASYIDITCKVLEDFGIRPMRWEDSSEGRACRVFAVPLREVFRVEDGTEVNVEGDWSGAAFWLAAGALSEEPLEVYGLDPASTQGDSAILDILETMGAQVFRMGDVVAVGRGEMGGAELDVSDTPDLVPPIALVAALIPGTTHITGAERLRLKESDRLETVAAALSALGADIRVEDEGLLIEGVSELHGGEVDSANDHRIAMMAAIAAAHASGPVTIHGAECVRKSYPGFFRDYASMGGRVQTEV